MSENPENLWEIAGSTIKSVSHKLDPRLSFLLRLTFEQVIECPGPARPAQRPGEVHGGPGAVTGPQCRVGGHLPQAERLVAELAAVGRARRLPQREGGGLVVRCQLGGQLEAALRLPGPAPSRLSPAVSRDSG